MIELIRLYGNLAAAVAEMGLALLERPEVRDPMHEPRFSTENPHPRPDTVLS